MRYSIRIQPLVILDEFILRSSRARDTLSDMLAYKAEQIRNRKYLICSLYHEIENPFRRFSIRNVIDFVQKS